MAVMKKENMVEEPKEDEVLTPAQYFDILTNKAMVAKEEQVRALYENAAAMMRRFKITGQKSGALKLYNFAKLCERELEVLKAGYTVYINRSDLDEYITKVADKAVVIIELENYERDVPDDVIDKIADCKEANLFDDYYVVFTDYSSGERKKVEEVRRDKDPILLGVLKIGNRSNNRLYHIASWEDEFCDLTLDRMVAAFDSSKHRTDNNAPSMAKSLTDEFGDINTFKESFNQFKKVERDD